MQVAADVVYKIIHCIRLFLSGEEEESYGEDSNSETAPPRFQGSSGKKYDYIIECALFVLKVIVRLVLQIHLLP